MEVKRILSNKKHKINSETTIPDYQIEALARVLLPEIQRFFDSEEGKREFEEWKREKSEKEHSKSKP